MAKFKVIEAFNLEGLTQEVGTEVELDEAMAAEHARSIEAVEEAGASAAGNEGADDASASNGADAGGAEVSASGENTAAPADESGANAA